MKIRDSVCLVTGSNRGIGRAIVEELVKSGAAKIYATARSTESFRQMVDLANRKIAVLTLDVTNGDHIRTVAASAQDTQILINNAAVNTFTPVISSADITPARYEMEVNYFGLINVTRAFVPILAKNGGGVLVNISSASAFVGIPINATYCAAKSAVHSLTQSMRGELRAQGTHVIGVYPGPIDTDMAAGYDMEKETPQHVAQEILKAIESGTEDVYPDEASRKFMENVSRDAKAIEREWSTVLPGTGRGVPEGEG